LRVIPVELKYNVPIVTDGTSKLPTGTIHRSPIFSGSLHPFPVFFTIQISGIGFVFLLVLLDIKKSFDPSGDIQD